MNATNTFGEAPAAGHNAPTTGPITDEELELASRNHAMPMEALQWDLTPAGMHYQLIHFDVPVLTADNWRLRIDGHVRRPLLLGLDELRGRPQQTLPVTLECAGNGRALLQPRPISQPWLHGGVGTAEWTGTPLAPLLDEAELDPDVVELVFTGADRGVQGDVEHDYARSLTVEEAKRVLLVYEMNGAPLPPQHGFPVRLLVPGWYGMASVKWLTSIDAVTEPFDGFQQIDSYRFSQGPDDPGAPVNRIRVRSLMTPPGIPIFLGRDRRVSAGTVRLTGRAWSGQAPVRRVEVAVDDHWAGAELGPALGEFAWRSWTYDWQAEAGEHVLACRATDAAGHSQPLKQSWNYQGMGNNEVQRVSVNVVD